MRYLSIILVALLMLSGVAIGATNSVPDYDNAIIVDGNGEVDQPYMRIKKVRYGAICSAGDGTQGIIPKLSSGDIVKWDTTSADGLTVSACSAAADVACGVLVTDLLTQDTLTVKAGNFGYMCVGGYCLAKIDDSGSPAAGIKLNVGSANTPALVALSISSDAFAILLSDPAADTLEKVWVVNQ